MAKGKLTKAAISFIIEKRNDWNVNYTFADIAHLLKVDFGITVTEQGVSKSYRKYKNDKDLSGSVTTTKSNQSEEIKTEEVKAVKRPIFKVIEVKVPEGRDFDENAGKKHDPAKYLKKINET